MCMIYNNFFFNVSDTDQGPEAPEEAEGRSVCAHKVINVLLLIKKWKVKEHFRRF